MKKFWLLLFFIYTSSSAFCQTTFEKLYNEPGYGTFFGGLIRNVDETLTTATVSQNVSNNSAKFGLLKMDTLGNVLWSRRYLPSFYYGEVRAVTQTPDKGYVIFGNVRQSILSFINIILIKTDSVGNLLWTKEFGDSASTYFALGVVSTSDSGLLIVSVAENNGYSLDMIKTDAQGNIAWSKALVTGSYTGAVCRTTDNLNLITSGYSDSFGNASILVIKIGDDGTIYWSNLYKDIVTSPLPYATASTVDGGCIISGIQFLLKLDAAGNILFYRTYGNSVTNFFSVIKTQDNGYLTCSNYFFSLNLTKMDSAGNVLWTVSPANSIFIFPAMLELPGGGFILSSTFLIYPDYSGYLLKTNPNGQHGCSINDFVTASTGNIQKSSASLSFQAINSSEVDVLTQGNSNITPSYKCNCQLIEPMISVVGVTDICYGDSVLLYTTVSGSNYTFQWQKELIDIPGATQNNYYASSSGNYQLIITEDIACTDLTNSIDIHVDSLIAIISAQGSTLLCPGDSVLLYDMVSDSSYDYQWSVDGALIPGATNSTFTAYNEGLYNVLIKDEANCSVYSNSIEVLDSCVFTGNNFLPGDLSFNVYPNPFHGSASLYLRNIAGVSGKVTICDISGKELLSLPLTTFENPMEIGEAWDTGFYLLTLTLNDRQIITKLLKQ